MARPPLIAIALALLLSTWGAVQAQTLADVDAQIRDGLPGAVANAEALAKARPADAAVWIALTRACLQVGKTERALDAAQQATRLAPNDAMAYNWLGNAYGARIGEVGTFSQLSMAPKLRAAFERAVALDPELMASRWALLEYYLQAPAIIGGGVDKARTQAVEIGKRDKANGFIAHARIAMHEKDAVQAVKFYEAALATKPADPVVRLTVVQAYQKLERWPDAFRLLRAWTAEDPKASAAWYQLGRTSAQSGLSLEEGAAALQRFLALPAVKGQPQRQHALYRLGQIQARAGNKELARASLLEALRIDPKLADARTELSKL